MTEINKKIKGSRESIGKKKRFDVFKRDGFICQYCGATPPSAVLEIDHIKPVSKGGCNDIDNLITSCFDCNRGKGAVELHVSPETIELKRQILEEKELQIKEFEKLNKKKRMRTEKQVDEIEKVFREYFEGFGFSRSFRTSVQRFGESLSHIDVIDAMEMACSRKSDPHDASSYFCGICWNKIRNKAGGHQ